MVVLNMFGINIDNITNNFYFNDLDHVIWERFLINCRIGDKERIKAHLGSVENSGYVTGAALAILYRNKERDLFKVLLDNYKGPIPLLLRPLCNDENLAVLQHVLKRLPITPAHHSLSLEYSATEGHVETTRFLLETTIDESALPFIWRTSIERGDYEIMRLLLEDGRVDPNVFDCYALKYYICSHKTKLVKLLAADKRVNVTFFHNYPLMKSYLACFDEIFRTLCHHPAITNPSNLKKLEENNRAYPDIMKKIKQVRHQRLWGILKSVCMFIVLFRTTLQKRYAPNGRVYETLHEHFNQNRNLKDY